MPSNEKTTTTATSVSVSRVIDAAATDIFAILADPSLHPVIDGSGTVVSVKGDTGQRLTMGTKFGMRMKIGLPYAMTNTVVEFEQDRLIAWQHVGGHRWRYELSEGEDGTTVTETFDWATSRAPLYITLMKWPQRHIGNMTRTLNRLEALVLNRKQPI